MRRIIMSRIHHISNRFRPNHAIHSFHTHYPSQSSPFKYLHQHIPIHNISSSTTSTSTTIRTSIRCFSDRKSGSFQQAQPIQKKKSSKEPDKPNKQQTGKKSHVIHSKTVSKSITSTTKTKKSNNGKTETVSTKTISHNTEIKNAENDVKMMYSQQMERTAEAENDDPHKSTSTTTTQTYKKLDIKSPEITDSHTEIKSSTETVSPLTEEDIANESKIYEGSTVEYDILTVGNPNETELERRKLMLNPHALIIHPDRLLPVVSTSAERKEEKWSFGRLKHRIKETFTSIRDRVVGEETYRQYEQHIKEKTDILSDEWDTSQNYHVVKLRSMMDRLNMQTESSRAMEMLQDDFSDFWVEDFLPEFDKMLCPLIVRAYLNDDIEFLNTICIGEAAVFCKNMIEQRINENKMLAPDILWIHEADLIETKLHDKKPQLIIRAEVQCVDCVYERGSDKVLEGSPSTVATNVFVFVLEPNLDPEYVNTVPLPWQIRSLTTARQRQIV